jgi:hypothetical protein
MLIVTALLAPVSCGNCADEGSKQQQQQGQALQPQPGTPKQPSMGRDPSGRGLRPGLLEGLDAGAAAPAGEGGP